ncbi:MAG: hypothetical protein HQK89_00645 [Nitrospirae bacterium]|nr:hypothetical protein [Nitrospirota bacterium]
MKSLLILFFLLFCMAVGTAGTLNSADSSFTQEDRERIIRLEEGLKATNQRITDLKESVNNDVKTLRESVNNDIKSLRDLSYVILGGIFVLITFVLWDRRTTLAPVVRTTRELEERTTKIEHVIKGKAEKDPELKKALKHAGLL